MKIKEDIFNIQGAKISGVNPLPSFRARIPAKLTCDENFPEELKADGGFLPKVLPYLTQDRYTHTKEELSLKSFVLENEYLHARFLPEYSGRLHSLYDKKAKTELLFKNSVIQPGNLAIRNAWLSGGIEWNIGNFGHTYTTCDNVFAAVLPDGEGNDFLRIYEFERNKSIFWQVDFHLPDGSPHLVAHVKMINPFPKNTTTYWWTNIAVPTDTKTRILASNKNVISFVGGECLYERLPNLKALPGTDVTYPNDSPRAFDYFIQKNKDGESTWEAAAYENGIVFYERSTAPLYYKKLFCWGNHRAGNHWQEFLSAGRGTGYYAELQAGIAPSQLHDKLLPANSTYEWTQCFGGVKLNPERLFDKNYDSAVDYFNNEIDSRISKNSIENLNVKYIRLANLPVDESNIRNFGSGFGALEAIRMEKDGDGSVPKSMCFPRSLIGDAEKPWLSLLENGSLENIPATDIPTSYMISEKWLPRIKEATEKSPTWNAFLHYGTAIYEYQRTDALINTVYNEEDDSRQIAEAERAFVESVRLEPSVWAYRNLAVLESRRGNNDAAEEYYDKAMSLPGVYDDFAIASEYMIFLNKNEKFEKSFEIYKALPDSCKSVDRIKISAAKAAVNLSEFDYLEKFFSEEHYDIREGEASLTDIWFEFSARKLADERGIKNPSKEVLDELIDEAWDTCPPDYSIDFRMSTDKKIRYRIS